MLQPTSLSARQEIIPKLGRRQYAVLQVLRRAFDTTNAEIAAELHLPINTITPRTLELRKLGRVVESRKRPCRVTGRTAIAWRAVPYPSSRRPVEAPITKQLQLV